MTTSIWQSYAGPGAVGLAVQPRSLSLFRAEQMATLTGSIRLEGDGASRRVVNGSELELRDAMLIDINGPDRRQRKERYLGTIAAGGLGRDRRGGRGDGPGARSTPARAPTRTRSSRELRTTWERRDENPGEIRLVAWVPRTMPGQVIEPPLDRQRGFTAVLVHLRSGPPPSPDGRALQPAGPRPGEADRAEPPASARP